MRTENIYSVYAHKNLKNDKYYVGMTSQEPKRRWNNGKGYQRHPKMWKDIQESDWKTDWVHGILGKFTDKNEALKYEAFLIAMLNSAREGYNTSSYDSRHYKRSEESKNHISESMTGNHNARQTPVLQFTKEGKFLAEYSSAHEAERQTGCYNGNICKCCKGKYKTCGGYVWKYKEGV